MPHLRPSDCCGKVGSSETLRVVCSEKILNVNTLTRNAHKRAPFFSHWLAGIIDGDGSLLVSRAGYSSCEITVGEKEWQILHKIKRQLGGAIAKRKGVGALRWRLHNKKGMLALVNVINGKCLLKARQEQLEKVCAVLGVNCLPPAGFSPKNGWCAGFFEAEGYFHVNSTTLQCSVTLSQKNPLLLREICKFLPAPLFYDKSWNGWLYAASSLADISCWLLYFSKFPLCSWKQIQLRRFKRIILYKARKVHLEKTGRSWKRLQRLVNEFMVNSAN